MKRLLLAMSLLACSAERKAPDAVAPEAPHSHADEGHEELPTSVKLSESVLKASGVKVQPARLEALAPTTDVTGEVVVDPDQTAVIVSPIAGRVVEVRLREGARVGASSVVVVIESQELARIRSTLASSVARSSAARRTLNRLEKLASDGLSTAQDRSDAEALAVSLETEVAALRQTLVAYGASETSPNPGRLTLRSPIAGVVLDRHVVVGQAVTPELELGRIANLDRAYFAARLFEKNLASVAPGRRADVRLNAYPGELFPGVVESVGKQLDATARTVIARITLRNKRDLLKIGLFGSARIVTDARAAAERRLVVPLSAVTRISDRDVVFVQHADGDFEMHPVTLGGSAAGLVEVLAGLREGELVAVDGVFTLKSIVLKSTFGEDE